MDKYGVGQDAYCYPGTVVLCNLLDLCDDSALARAERDFSELAAASSHSSSLLTIFPISRGFIARFFRIFMRGLEKFARSIFPKATRVSAM